MFRPVVTAYQLLPRRDRLKFTLIVAARTMVQLLDLLGLAAVGFLAALLASGLNNQGEASFLGYSVSLQDSRQVLWTVVVTALLFVGKSALASYLLRLTTKFLARVEAVASVRVMRALFEGGLDRVSRETSGEHIWISNTSSHIAFSAMLFAGSNMISESVLFLAILGAFVIVDGATALLVAGYFVLVVFLFQISVTTRLKRLGKRLSESLVQSNNAVLNLSEAFREIRVGEKLDAYVENYSKHRTQYATDQMLNRFVMGLPRFFVEASLMVGFLGLFVWKFSQGSITDGLVTTGVFLTGGARMMASLLPLQNAVAEIRTRGPQAERAQQILRDAQKSEELVFQPAGDSQSSTEGSQRRAYSVTVEALSFRYSGSNVDALSSLSFKIARGQFAAVVGPSGAGKTTLADLLLGLRNPSSGEIRLDGEEPAHRRVLAPGSVAYVPQRPGMVVGTIAENVALSPDGRGIDRERVEEVLQQAGLGNLIRTIPRGIDAELGAQKDALSGGQLQRLGIARALYTQPRMLILDEATSALDAATERLVADSVKELAGTTTVIVIAHRLSTIQNADTVLVIEEGKLSAQGTFREVRKKVPLIEKYVQLMKVED